MCVKTGKAFVDPSAMTTQMTEDSDLWSFATFNDLEFAKAFVHHKASKDGPGIAQVDNSTTRLITF